MSPYENLIVVLSRLANNARDKSIQETRRRTSRQEYRGAATAYEHSLELLREAMASEHS